MSEAGRRRSKRKQQEMSQVGLGFFYTPTSALTCAHNLPEAACKVGQLISGPWRKVCIQMRMPLSYAHLEAQNFGPVGLECGSYNNVALLSCDLAHETTSSYLRSSYGHACCTECNAMNVLQQQFMAISQLESDE